MLGEIKDRRTQLLLKPSVFSDITKICAMESVTLNQLITEFIEIKIKENADMIEKYDEMFPTQQRAGE
jgi:hypothetical protein